MPGLASSGTGNARRCRASRIAPSSPGSPRPFPLSKIDAADIAQLAHGTTVGTNALIERRIGRVAIVTTGGFRDLIEIGRQTRPKIYDVHLDNPPPLVPRQLRFEVAERMLATGAVLRPLDEDEVRRVAHEIAATGIDCVAVCFLHSHAYPEHEARATAIIRGVLGSAIPVLSSSAVYPEFREYERFSTAVLNGALLTVMHAYLERFAADVKKIGIVVEPTISQSAGGLLSLARARELPVRTALSGPAAGVIGATRRAVAAGHGNIITIDVGGTSTDVSLISRGVPSLIAERPLAGFPLRMPTLDVNAVGAGGGSIAWIDRDGLLKVGPRSAGADPGPLCYDRGGAAVTVTDANVVLGRLNGEALLDGRMPIRKTLAEKGIAQLADQLSLSPTETALGIVRLASANMVRAIRTISVERGHRPGDFVLFAFGGAGPLHAVEVARELDIPTIVVPPNPGLLCAEGLLFSDLAMDFVRSVVGELRPELMAELGRARAALLDQAKTWFVQEKVPAARQKMRWTAEMRFIGQNFELSVPLADAPFAAASSATMQRAFRAAHEVAYGYASETEPIELVNLRLAVVGELDRIDIEPLANRAPGRPVGRRRAIFSLTGESDTPIFRRDVLGVGQRIAGPAIVEQLDSTTLVYPGDSCGVDEWGNLLIDLAPARPA